MKKYILLLLIIIMCVNVVSADIPNTDYYIKFEDFNNNIWHMFTNTPVKVEERSIESGYAYDMYLTSNATYWYKKDGNDNIESRTTGSDAKVTFQVIKNMKKANHDVLIRGTTTVFFSKTVMGMKEMIQGMNLLEILTHPLVGLIAYLIGLWIIYLGFSKAWQFLSKTLRGA